jgi:hypothetical protein
VTTAIGGALLMDVAVTADHPKSPIAIEVSAPPSRVPIIGEWVFIATTDDDVRGWVAAVDWRLRDDVWRVRITLSAQPFATS